jgi:hypothetical protein
MNISACESWTCINSFAPWLAAIGTISTLVWTIRIATNDRRPRVRASNWVLMTKTPTVLGPSGTATLSTPDFTPFFEAQVVNIGQCPVIIDACSWLIQLDWSTRLVLKEHQSSSPLVQAEQSTLPSTLKYGERSKFIFDIFTLPPPTHALHGVSFKCAAWIRVQSLKFEIRTSVGQYIRVKADSEIKKRVWQEYRRQYFGCA